MAPIIRKIMKLSKWLDIVQLFLVSFSSAKSRSYRNQPPILTLRLPNFHIFFIQSDCFYQNYPKVQADNYEIFLKIFHIIHNLTWYSEIVQRFTRISKFCSTYELTKQFMEIYVKHCAINLKKNNLYIFPLLANFESWWWKHFQPINTNQI